MGSGQGNISISNSKVYDYVTLDESTLVDSEIRGGLLSPENYWPSYSGIGGSYIFNSKINRASILSSDLVNTPVKNSIIQGRQKDVRIKMSSSSVSNSRVYNHSGYDGVSPAHSINVNETVLNCKWLNLQDGYFGFVANYKMIDHIDAYRNNSLSTCPMELLEEN